MVTCCTQQYNRTVIRGDSDRFKVTFTKKTVVNGKDVYEPIDITDWNVRFTIRTDVPSTETRNDKDAIFTMDAKLIAPEEGKAVVFVPAEETTKWEPGTYYYDIQYIRPADEFGNHQIRSIRKAKYIIVGDITRDNAYTIDGGVAADFMTTDETDYVIAFNVEYEEIIPDPEDETEETGEKQPEENEGEETEQPETEETPEEPEEEEPEYEERLVPYPILDPCKGYNGGCSEDDPIERFIDCGNAKAEKPAIKFNKRKPSFFDDYNAVEDDADDGYEI